MSYPVLRPNREVPDHYRPSAPSELVEAARAYVATAQWTFARTMPQYPHHYTLRRTAEARGTADGYDALRELILDHHYLRTWHGRSFRAVTLGGLNMWVMQHGGTLINGKPAEADDWPTDEPTLFDFL